MALQHAPSTLPGAEEYLPADPPDGSIAATIRRFHAESVTGMAVTGRRAYERALVLLVRDLAESGPALEGPITSLGPDRLEQHLHWRARAGMDHAGDLPRAA